MLIVSRHPVIRRDGTRVSDETLSKFTIMVDDIKIEVSLIENRGNQSKIGIKAPRKVQVLRNELLL